MVYSVFSSESPLNINSKYNKAFVQHSFIKNLGVILITFARVARQMFETMWVTTVCMPSSRACQTPGEFLRMMPQEAL